MRFMETKATLFSYFGAVLEGERVSFSVILARIHGYSEFFIKQRTDQELTARYLIF